MFSQRHDIGESGGFKIIKNKMDNGFIVLHRKLLNHPIAGDAYLLALFVHLLLSAAHKETRFLWNGKEEILKRGQLITGRFALAEQTGINPSTLYKKLKILENLGICNIKSNNKFSLITIVKYSDYQDKPDKNNTTHNNNVTTTEQQRNTYNNINNINNNMQTVEPSAQGKEIGEIIKMMKTHINPTLTYNNTTQRKALQEMLDNPDIGYEKLRLAVQLLCEIDKTSDEAEFLPVITTPIQLRNKYGQLREWAIKNKIIKQQQYAARKTM